MKNTNLISDEKNTIQVEGVEKNDFIALTNWSSGLRCQFLTLPLKNFGSAIPGAG